MTTPFFGDKSITDTSKDFIDSLNPLSEKIFSNLGESRSKTTRGAESSVMDSLQRLSAITQRVADIEKAFQLIQKGNQWHDTVPDLLCERDLYALVSAPKVTKHSKGDPETIIGVTIGEDHTITSVTATEGTQGASAVGTLPVDQAIVERLQKIHDDTVDTYLNQYMVPAKTLLDNIIRVADAATIPGCQNPVRTPTTATITTPLTPMEKKLHTIVDDIISNGTPYAWGGGTLDGPSLGTGDGGGDATKHRDYEKVGFDCSALTRYLVHETTGIDVGRVSQDQYHTTTEIPDKNNPSVGNLGFPRGQSKWVNGGPGHVVMYMGDGVIVEAPESGKYVKNTIASDKGDYVWHEVTR